MRSGQNAWLASLAPGLILNADGVVGCANRMALALWRHEREEDFVGRPFASLWLDAGAANAALEALGSGSAWQGEMEAVAADGVAVPAEVLLELDAAERGGDGGYVCSVLPLRSKQ